MATKELRELRHKYKAAYTSYMHCVQAFSDATERGEMPNDPIVEAESVAFTELMLVRHELMERLREHGEKKKAAQNSK
jgi:hypothetical protein